MDDSRPSRRFSGAVTRRPAVLAALVLIAGILAHPILPPHPLLWAILIAVLVFISILIIRATAICCLCIFAAVFFIGVALAQLQDSFLPRNHIGLFTGSSERLAELELRITDPPQISGGMAEMRMLPPKQIAMAEVRAVKSAGGWEPAVGKIHITIEPPDDRLHAGQVIRALGFLSRPEAPSNPGQFNFAEYDRRQGILASFIVRRAETIQIIGSDEWSILPRFREEARLFLAAGFSLPHVNDAEFLELLTLGDSDARLPDVRDDFANAGVAYQLSISGLHIAIVGGAVLLILRLLRVRPRPAVWIALAVVALYAATALPTQTGARSLIMCAAGAAGLLSRRKADAFQLLALAVMAVLLINPSELYEAGFQIGMVAVLGLVLFAGRIGLFITRLWQSDDPWAQHQHQPGVVRGIFRWIGNALWQTFLISAVVWVMVLPLVAYHFQQTNPWSVPGGVVLMPFTVVTLLGGILKIILTAVLPPLAGWWATLAGGPAIVLRHMVGWLAHLPGASIPSAPPAIWMIAIYYALVCLPLISWRQRGRRMAMRFSPLLACVAIIFIPAPTPGMPVWPETAHHSAGVGGVRVTFLSIGAGQTALVRVSGGQTFFVDCGSTPIPDVYRSVIQPYLREEGVRRVDQIFLSHGDYDHISAAGEIVHTFGVPSVRLTPYFRVHAGGNVPAEALLHLLDTQGPAPTLTLAGSQIDLGGGATARVLWPPANCDMNSNNCGMVVKLDFAGKSILFPADIQEPPELELLKHPRDLKSDVLVAPHHGSAETSTPAFLHAVDPEFIVCSNGRMLSHKQVVFDQIAAQWPVYRTDRCGAIDVMINGDGQIDVETFTGAAAVGGREVSHR